MADRAAGEDGMQRQGLAPQRGGDFRRVGRIAPEEAGQASGLVALAGVWHGQSAVGTK